MMGGCIEWAALDTVASVIGVDDPDAWLTGLMTIRDWQLRKVAADAAESDSEGVDE